MIKSQPIEVNCPLEQTMPFTKTLIRQSLPMLVVSGICSANPGTALAQDTKAADKATDSASQKAADSTQTNATPPAGTPVTELVKKPVNEKILPLIKEGYGYLSKGAYDKAIKVLKKAVSEDKDCISARRYLAYALIQKGEAKEALGEMQTVSKLVPPNAFDFYLFGSAYYAAGGVKEAHDCFTEALRQNPGYDAARAGLVKSLARQNNFEEALNNVQQGMQMSKDEAVKKYYTSLSKAVMEAQSYQQQTANGSLMPPSGGSLAQIGGDSVKSAPVVIK